jgi:HPt (histidine-containing phosphotransfer) domain-containing protein
MLDALAVEMEDGAIVLDVVAAYLGQLPSRCDGIVAAGGTGDLATVADLAHALRSSSFMLGAGVLGSLAEQLERSARSGDLVTVRTLVTPLVPECARVDVSLRGWHPA